MPPFFNIGSEISYHVMSCHIILARMTPHPTGKTTLGDLFWRSVANHPGHWGYSYREVKKAARTSMTANNKEGGVARASDPESPQEEASKQ